MPLQCSKARCWLPSRDAADLVYAIHAVYILTSTYVMFVTGCMIVEVTHGYLLNTSGCLSWREHKYPLLVALLRRQGFATSTFFVSILYPLSPPPSLIHLDSPASPRRKDGLERRSRSNKSPSDKDRHRRARRSRKRAQARRIPEHAHPIPQRSAHHHQRRHRPAPCQQEALHRDRVRLPLSHFATPFPFPFPNSIVCPLLQLTTAES